MTEIMIGSKKGLLFAKLEDDEWQWRGPMFEGCHISRAQQDPRDGTLWVAVDTGHWGCKLHRSFDNGVNWEEVAAPKYPQGEWVRQGKEATLTYIWSFAFPEDKPDVVLMGTSPGGLFISQDGGDSWQLNRPLWDWPERQKTWFAGGQGNMGAALHALHCDGDSIMVGVSAAGVFKSDDFGESWRVCNEGQVSYFLSDFTAEVGHDPHCLSVCELEPSRVWMQNHCGVYRSDDGGETWIHVSEGVENFDPSDPYTGMGAAFQGFAIHAHPFKPDTAWVVPMKSDEYRVAVDSQVMAIRTDDAGKTWRKLTNGLPSDAFDLVLRHASHMVYPRLAFGSTTGSLWFSQDEGESFQTLCNFLPPIHSIEILN